MNCVWDGICMWSLDCWELVRAFNRQGPTREIWDFHFYLTIRPRYIIDSGGEMSKIMGLNLIQMMTTTRVTGNLISLIKVRCLKRSLTHSGDSTTDFYVDYSFQEFTQIPRLKTSRLKKIFLLN